MIIFWDGWPCILVEVYWLFGGMYHLHIWCLLLPASCWLPGGDSMFPWYTSKLVQDCMVSCQKRWYCSEVIQSTSHIQYCSNSFSKIFTTLVTNNATVCLPLCRTMTTDASIMPSLLIYTTYSVQQQNSKSSTFHNKQNKLNILNLKYKARGTISFIQTINNIMTIYQE